MDEQFLRILACPKTGAELQLVVHERFADGTVKTGELISFSKQDKYPITNGIPRFHVGESYADSFDYEWHRFSTTQLDGENRHTSTHDASLTSFVSQTTFSPNLIRDKWVVDFGCGAGRYLDVVRRFGGVAVGIDLTNAVEVARRNLAGDRNVLLVQASVFAPPFKQDVFDFGFTIGVLHHTPSPAKGLKGLISVVKPGGMVAVSVYPDGGFYSFPSVYWVRKFINLVERECGKRFAFRAAMIYAHLSSFLFYPLFRLLELIPWFGRASAGLFAYFFAVIIVNPNWRWRILDTFDAITPKFASTHHAEDLEFWLETFGCKDIKGTGVQYEYSKTKPTNYVATKE